MILHILFYIFSTLVIIGALGVITSRHPVRAVLFLVFTFVASSAVWLTLQAEFLALVLIVVYVGAVMVLFLFVVMMLNVQQEARKAAFVSYWPIALVTGLLIVGLLAAMIGQHRFGLILYPMPAMAPAHYSNIAALGIVLFTKFVYPFEVAGVLLLAAMIAAITLTFRGRRDTTKAQMIHRQIKVKPEDRLRIVKMKAEKKQ
jgi:NADH-quinone oxidoreductase subunit J